MNLGLSPHSIEKEERARNVMKDSILSMRKIQETILLDNMELDESSFK